MPLQFLFMKLIVCDSGSTKADWLVAEDGKITAEFSTMGFNPFFHDAGKVFSELSRNPTALMLKDAKATLFFFGAGCSSPERNQIIKSGLQRFFINAEITVEHDMLGAALAACGHSAGLVCILGTGSNIAFYDGKNLSETRHGLGFIIGDEGSGSYYGKKLISSFLYGIMPDELSRKFFDKYKMTKELMIENVYHRPNANVYLASFSPFLSENKDHPWIQQLVYKGMKEFYETNIISYPEHKTYLVHFIGSIAFYFSSILKNTAKDCGFTVGKIIVRPVEDLMKYFLEN